MLVACTMPPEYEVDYCQASWLCVEGIRRKRSHSCLRNGRVVQNGQTLRACLGLGGTRFTLYQDAIPQAVRAALDGPKCGVVQNVQGATGLYFNARGPMELLAIGKADDSVVIDRGAFFR